MRNSVIGKCLFLAVSAAFIVPLFFISGCGQKPVKSDDIVVWHWMTDRQKAFLALAAKYKELTGKEVRFELYAPSQTYSAKVRAAAQTRTLPDIFGILEESKDFASFIKAGFVTDLTQYMEENNDAWKNVFFPKALDNNQFKANNEYGVKPGIYGVPIDVTNVQFVYNKKLFIKAGLDPDNPPQTWDEYLEAGKKLLASGTPVLVSGFGELWLLDCLASNFAWNIMGKDKILATIKGDVPYTDPDWIQVLTLFQEMYQNNLITKGAGAMVNKVAEQKFANGRSAIAFNGSWCVNVYHGMNPDLDYGVMPPPQVSDKYPCAIWGGAGSSFMVNPDSVVKEQAIEFLRWLTEVPQQVYLAEKTNNLPSNRYSLKKIPPVLSQFVDDMDIVVHPRQLPAGEFPRVIEMFDRGIQNIIVGEKTPLEVAQEVQKLKERELKRAKR